MSLIRGDRLNADQRAQVLRAFVHRHTTENARQTYGGRCPNCAQSVRNGVVVTGSKRGPVPLQVRTEAEWHAYHTSKGADLISDEEWLRRHAFHFIADGSRLNARKHYAEPVGLVDA